MGRRKRAIFEQDHSIISLEIGGSVLSFEDTKSDLLTKKDKIARFS